MREAELYQKLLDLEAPWFVSEAKIDLETQKIDLLAGHSGRTQLPCPECDKTCAVYDHMPRPS